MSSFTDVTTTPMATEQRPIGSAAPAGCAILDPSQTAVFSAIDTRVVGHAESRGAAAVVGPGLLATELLDRIDFFQNFPHLALHPATYGESYREQLARGTRPAETPVEALVPGDGLLPSATCYGVFGSLSGAELDVTSTYTAVGRCFRNEESYTGLARLLSFHMREVIAVGRQEDIEEFRSWGIDVVNGLASKLGLKLKFEPANDPFYLKSSRALLTAIDPVKFEFVAPDGTAIASINRHRNFFGERLGITIGGKPAHSACLAFGLERWVHALTQVHGSASAARTALER